jgi:hypothetical protein
MIMPSKKRPMPGFAGCGCAEEVVPLPPLVVAAEVLVEAPDVTDTLPEVRPPPRGLVVLPLVAPVPLTEAVAFVFVWDAIWMPSSSLSGSCRMMRHAVARNFLAIIAVSFADRVLLGM